MARHPEDVQLSCLADATRKYAERSNQALLHLVGAFGPDAGVALVDDLEGLAHKASDHWTALFSEYSRDNATDELRDPRRPRPPGAGMPVLPDNEDEDDGHPDSSPGHSSLLFPWKIRSLVEHGNAPSLGRREELQHPDKNRGLVLPDCDFIEAVSIRLGILGLIDIVACTLCGEVSFEGVGPHGLCCAKTEWTKGHTSVTKQLAEEVGTVDPTMEVERRGLLPGNLLELLTYRRARSGMAWSPTTSALPVVTLKASVRIFWKS